MATSVKGPDGKHLPVRWAHRQAIITLTGPMTTREAADEIATAVVRECYRNAYLERLALRTHPKHGAASEHFSCYIQPRDEPRVRPWHASLPLVIGRPPRPPHPSVHVSYQHRAPPPPSWRPARSPTRRRGSPRTSSSTTLT